MAGHFSKKREKWRTPSYFRLLIKQARVILPRQRGPPAMYVSTLQDFVKAMGGELRIIAKFPEGTVEISQFEDAKKAAAGKD